MQGLKDAAAEGGATQLCGVEVAVKVLEGECAARPSVLSRNLGQESGRSKHASKAYWPTILAWGEHALHACWLLGSYSFVQLWLLHC